MAWRGRRRFNPHRSTARPVPTYTPEPEPAGSVWAREYPSWGALAHDAATGRSALSATGRTSRDTDSDFRGTASFADAHRLSTQGWPEGYRHARHLADALWARLSPRIKLPVVTYDVTGEMLDVGRLCAGEPEHWGQWETVDAAGVSSRFVRVVYNIGARGWADKSLLIARGATVAALVELLEHAGHRVQVEIVSYATGDRRAIRVSAPVKLYDESLDRDRLIYAVAHPSALRRHIFSIRELAPEPFLRDLHIGKEYGAGYGSSQDIPGTERGDIYIPALTNEGGLDWTNAATTEAWVLRTLRAAGVTFTEV